MKTRDMLVIILCSDYIITPIVCIFIKVSCT